MLGGRSISGAPRRAGTDALSPRAVPPSPPLSQGLLRLCSQHRGLCPALGPPQELYRDLTCRKCCRAAPAAALDTQHRAGSLGTFRKQSQVNSEDNQKVTWDKLCSWPGQSPEHRHKAPSAHMPSCPQTSLRCCHVGGALFAQGTWHRPQGTGDLSRGSLETCHLLSGTCPSFKLFCFWRPLP